MIVLWVRLDVPDVFEQIALDQSTVDSYLNTGRGLVGQVVFFRGQMLLDVSNFVVELHGSSAEVNTYSAGRFVKPLIVGLDGGNRFRWKSRRVDANGHSPVLDYAGIEKAEFIHEIVQASLESCDSLNASPQGIEHGIRAPKPDVGPSLIEASWPFSPGRGNRFLLEIKRIRSLYSAIRPLIQLSLRSRTHQPCGV